MLLTKFLRELANDKTGATAVEYGLIVSLIVIAAVGAFQAVANENTSMWGSVQTAAEESMGGGDG
ncbi:MAG: Flp family type IVb pilin [Pseudomonadota bacterium]